MNPIIKTLYALERELIESAIERESALLCRIAGPGSSSGMDLEEAYLQADRALGRATRAVIARRAQDAILRSATAAETIVNARVMQDPEGRQKL